MPQNKNNIIKKNDDPLYDSKYAIVNSLIDLIELRNKFNFKFKLKFSKQEHSKLSSKLYSTSVSS